MDISSNLTNVSSISINRDTKSTAVAKNVMVVILGLIINYVNGTLVHTFRKHQVFYVNPRYILFIHLVLNDMIQLAASINNAPLTLAVMAVECYIAVCFPLKHSKWCTIKKTYIVIGCIWGLSAVSVIPDIFLLIATEPDRLFYSTIFCHRDNLFRHPVSLKKRDVSCLFYLPVVWLVLLYTYFRIFLAARAINSVDGNAKKARNTVLLHGFQLVLSMLTYLDEAIRLALLNWFPKNIIEILFALFIIIQILPRFVSPIVYGLRDKTFKKYLIKHLPCSLTAGKD